MNRGVTLRTALRRNQVWREFTAFLTTRKLSFHVDSVSKFATGRWPNVSTRHTNVVTLIADARRRDQPIPGDSAGYVRELQKQLLYHKPTRAETFDPKVIHCILRLISIPEDRHLITLMWGSAHRLTSFLLLRRSDINELTQLTDSLWAATFTFRTGKTIISTGPYSIRIAFPADTARWIQQFSGDAVLWTSTAEVYYRRLRPALHAHGVTIKSIRRAALQHLALQREHPEQLLLLSRHTQVRGLYAYLNDGRFATWETDKQQQMSTKLWPSPV